MTLMANVNDEYQVLQFSSARSFTSTGTGTDSYTNAGGTYRIRFKPVSGAALAALLAMSEHSGKTACWNFQFTTSGGSTTQPTISYCR